MAHRYIIYPPDGPKLNGRPVGCCECARWADCVDPVTICPNAGKIYIFIFLYMSRFFLNLFLNPKSVASIVLDLISFWIFRSCLSTKYVGLCLLPSRIYI